MCGAQTAGLSQLLTAVPVYVRVALVLHDCCRARPYSHFTFGVSFVGSFCSTLYCMRRVEQPSRTLTDVPVELCVRHVRCVVPSFRTQTIALRSVYGSNPKAVTPPRGETIYGLHVRRAQTPGLSQLLIVVPVCVLPSF